MSAQMEHLRQRFKSFDIILDLRAIVLNRCILIDASSLL